MKFFYCVLVIVFQFVFALFAFTAVGNAIKIQVYRVRERATNQECGEIFAVLLLHWYSPTIILAHCPSVCESS